MTLQSIENGETNIKGYFVHSLINTQIKELMKGTRDEELPEILSKVMEEAVKKCLSILEGEVAQKTVDELDQIPLGTPSQVTDNWDFMVRRLKNAKHPPSGLAV